MEKLEKRVQTIIEQVKEMDLLDALKETSPGFNWFRSIYERENSIVEPYIYPIGITDKEERRERIVLYHSYMDVAIKLFREKVEEHLIVVLVEYKYKTWTKLFEVAWSRGHHAGFQLVWDKYVELLTDYRNGKVNLESL